MVERNNKPDNNNERLLGLIKHQVASFLILTLDESLWEKVLGKKYKELTNWRRGVQNGDINNIIKHLWWQKLNLELFYANVANQREKYILSIIDDLKSDSDKIINWIKPLLGNAASITNFDYNQISDSLKVYIRFKLEYSVVVNFVKVEHQILNQILISDMEDYKNQCFHLIRNAWPLSQDKIDSIKLQMESYFDELKRLPAKNALDYLRRNSSSK